MRTLFLLTAITAGLYLFACTPMRSDHTGRVCKALTDDIQFEPLTSNIRRSEIADTNLPLAERDYDIADCSDQ